MSEKTTDERTARKVREGLVVSDKMDKTITVLVEDRVKHPLYGKVLRTSERLKAHDEQNTAGLGDRASTGPFDESEANPGSTGKRSGSRRASNDALDDLFAERGSSL